MRPSPTRGMTSSAFGPLRRLICPCSRIKVRLRRSPDGEDHNARYAEHEAKPALATFSGAPPRGRSTATLRRAFRPPSSTSFPNRRKLHAPPHRLGPVRVVKVEIQSPLVPQSIRADCGVKQLQTPPGLSSFGKESATLLNSFAFVARFRRRAQATLRRLVGYASDRD